MASFESIARALEELPRTVDPKKLAGMTMTTHFHLSGSDAADWILRVDDGNLSVARGTPDKADLTLTASSDALLAMFNGTLNPVSAYMLGRIKVEGDLTRAMRLQAIFPNAGA